MKNFRASIGLEGAHTTRRSVTCTVIASKAMNDVFGRIYIDLQFPEEEKRAVEESIQNLKKAFSDSFESVSWLDKDTKDYAQKKVFH
jgi:predicted metalloendopeptidase